MNGGGSIATSLLIIRYIIIALVLKRRCWVSPLRKHGCFKLSVKMLLLQPCTLLEEEEEEECIFHCTMWHRTFKY
jgi:hypothetical protein